MQFQNKNGTAGKSSKLNWKIIWTKNNIKSHEAKATTITQISCAHYNQRHFFLNKTSAGSL